jgi:hypothetical protein
MCMYICYLMYELCVCMLLDADCVSSQKMYANCFFFYKLNADCVFYPAVTIVDSSSNGWITSPCPSLLGATIAMGRRRTSLLSYHCSDILVATDRLPVTTVTYGPLLQCLFVVMQIESNTSTPTP